MPSEPWVITDDSGLRDAVRDETAYDTGKIDTETLKGLLDSAKRILALQADVTSFYDDRGITMALLGVTCIKAKSHVENQPVRVKNLAGEDVTFRTTDGSSLQVEEYEEMTRLGLAESDKTDKGTTEIRLTRTFLHD
jgi:hypothetical protein